MTEKTLSRESRGNRVLFSVSHMKMKQKQHENILTSFLKPI